MFRKFAHLLVILLLLLLGRTALAKPAALPEDLDRSTPQASVEYFLNATRQGRFEDAALILDLRTLPAAQRGRGPELARQLRYVLDRKLRVDLADLSKEPSGNLQDGPLTDTVGEISLAGVQVPIKLQRIPSPPGAAWVFSRSTVQSIPELYDAHGPGVIGERLPAWSHRVGFWHMALWQWIALCVAALLSWLLAVVAVYPVLAIGRRIARRTATPVDDLAVEHAKGPLRALVALILVRGAVEPLRLSIVAQENVTKLLLAAGILVGTWTAMRMVETITDVLLARLVQGVATDSVVRHGQQSRMKVARQSVNGLVGFVGICVALMQFELVRKIGVSLLASAGLIGIVIGVAAQKSVANLVAGIQIMVAQPIRIGDRVNITGDVGWIEEITLTYVTMKTWDGRRRVLPITYFIENQFDNWTKTSEEKVAQVVLHADYAVPVEKVRAKAKELVEADPDWNGTIADLVVIDATDRTLALRVTASAADGARAFALSCRVREALAAHLGELDGGAYLPRGRLSLADTRG